MRALKPGSTLGILGGGQLGRLLALGAAQLGYRTHIFCDEEDAPARDVSTVSTQAAYNDKTALRRFAKQVDAATVEFENIPVEALRYLQRGCPVYPPPHALAITQDRLSEKDFVQALGLPLAPYALVTRSDDVPGALAHCGLPAILKTRRLGYDGKGQIRIASAAQAAKAWQKLGGVPCVLEAFVTLKAELSVVLARGADGQVIVYDVARNDHRRHILHQSRVPSGFSVQLTKKAQRIALRLAHALDYVGVMAVEFFVDRQERLLVNELAPRVHNSGHWTLDGAVTSQFENHMRAVAGLPLGSSRRLADVVMTNLIGADIFRLNRWVKDPEAKLWLYGKAQARPGRKMGHVTQMRPILIDRP